MFVIDLENNHYPVQATIIKEQELNGNQSVSTTLLPSNVNLAFIKDISEMWRMDIDDVEYKVVYAKRKGTGRSLTVEIKAVPLFFDIFDTQRIYERYEQHMTAMNCFTLIFQSSGYNFVLVDNFDAVDWEGLGDGETRLSAFKRALNRYGAEFRIEGSTVYLERRIGRDTNFMYRYRLNASNITQEIDGTAFYTYARGYGDYAEGEEHQAKLIREYTSPLAGVVGIREAPPIKNGNIMVPETMDDALKKLVDESLMISISTDILDLRKQGYELAQPEVGDRVFVIDERIGLREEVRINHLSVKKNWRGEVVDIALVLGTGAISRRYQSNLNTAAKEFLDVLNGRKHLPFSILPAVQQAAMRRLEEAQTELIFGNAENGVQGIIAQDKNDPNKLMWLNSNGWMISDDGGQSAKVAATADGLVAETIIGQSIIGVNLSSIDESGYFHVNGHDAEFVDTDTGRRVSISPDGIYGYNSNNSLRFRADGTMVTSASLGTSQSNVYLAAQSGNEARVVDFADIPGDGLINSYTYLPIRGSGFYGNFWNINSALSGAHLYARPLSGGELRVTLNGMTTNYQNFRADWLYGNRLLVNDLHGSQTHMYIGTINDGELRVVNGSSTDTYRTVRARGYLGDYLDKSAFSSGDHIFVRPAGGTGELRVTVRGSESTYRPVRASNFLLPSGADAFVSTFSLLSDSPTEAEEASAFLSNVEVVRHSDDGATSFKIHSEDTNTVGTGGAVDVDKTLGVLVKSVQEMLERLDKIDGDLGG